MADHATRELLDIGTVILLPRLRDPSVLAGDSTISVITLAELSAGPLIANDDTERGARQAQPQQAEADFQPVPFDAAAARAFGRVAADLRRAGRTASTRAFDALIAATAVAHDMPVYTVNPDDFAGISGLRVVPVPHPDAALDD